MVGINDFSAIFGSKNQKGANLTCVMLLLQMILTALKANRKALIMN